VGGKSSSSVVNPSCNDAGTICEYFSQDETGAKPLLDVHTAGMFNPLAIISNVTTQSLDPAFPKPENDTCSLEFRLADFPSEPSNQHSSLCSMTYPCYKSNNSTALETYRMMCHRHRVVVEIEPALSPERTVRRFTLYVTREGHLSFNATGSHDLATTHEFDDVKYTLTGVEAYDTYRGAAGDCIEDWCIWDVEGKEVLIDHPRFADAKKFEPEVGFGAKGGGTACWAYPQPEGCPAMSCMQIEAFTDSSFRSRCAA
jgi:hypothetical protein